MSSKENIPLQPSNEQLEAMFTYFGKKGAVDLQNQNARPQDREIAESILRMAAAEWDIVEWTKPVKAINPSGIRKIAMQNIFQAPGVDAFKGLSIDNLVVAPETSTTFLRAARTIAAEYARKQKGQNIIPVMLVPEGNYRRNSNYDSVTGVKMVNIPIDPVTCKITPGSYEHTIAECVRNGQTPVLLQLESPNNPWMQIYSADEQKAICDITTKNDMYLLNDCYLMDTEYPLKQKYFAEFSNTPEKVVTTYGMRRVGDVDSFGKAGFAITHDPALANQLKQYLVGQQISFTAGNLKTAERVLSELMTPEKVKEKAKLLHEYPAPSAPGIAPISSVLPSGNTMRCHATMTRDWPYATFEVRFW